jgi:hypothetical protein
VIKIIVGDCRAVMRSLPEESVQACITSPPYYGLREYGIEPSLWDGDLVDCDHEWGQPHRTAWANSVQGEKGGRGGKNINYRTTAKETGPFCVKCGCWRGVLGMEPDFREFIAHVVDVFREVRRVLRPDGVVFLNLGDSYATGAGAVGDHPGGGEQGARWVGRPALGKTAWAGRNVPGNHRGQEGRWRGEGSKHDYGIGRLCLIILVCLITLAFAQKAYASSRIASAHQFNQDHIAGVNVAPVEVERQPSADVAIGAPEVIDEWSVMRLPLAERKIIFNRSQNNRHHFYRRVSPKIFQTGDFSFWNNQRAGNNQIVLSTGKQWAFDYRASSRCAVAFLQLSHLTGNIVVQEEWENRCGQRDALRGRSSLFLQKTLILKIAFR